MKYVYKVVREWDGKQGKSAVILKGPYSRTYELNKKTSAARGSVGICVFKQLQDARVFTCAVIRPTVLKCTYNGELRKITKLTQCTNLIRATVLFTQQEYMELFSNASVPDGTHGVDAVTPVEVVR